MSADLGQLRELSTIEKLRIIEELWDDIGSSDATAVVQDWHKAEARKRTAELEAQPDIALTREELWQRVEEGDG